jgi:hypothetical protein
VPVQRRPDHDMDWYRFKGMEMAYTLKHSSRRKIFGVVVSYGQVLNLFSPKSLIFFSIERHGLGPAKSILC